MVQGRVHSRPILVETPRQQRRHGKRERHGDAHVAEIERRRVEDHARVLQQRIEIVAIAGRRDQPRKRIRREQRERDDACADDAENAEHAAGKLLRLRAATRRDGHRPDREHGDPQQHRAFVPAPSSRCLVEHGQGRVRMQRDEADAEVVCQQCVLERTECDRDEHELPCRRRSRQRHPIGSPARCADQWHDGLHERQAERECERELTELRDH